MHAFTDYPFISLGDISNKVAPVRAIMVLSYDGDKYCRILVNGIEEEIKAGYIYTEEGRYGAAPNITLNVLNGLLMNTAETTQSYAQNAINAQTAAFNTDAQMGVELGNILSAEFDNLLSLFPCLNTNKNIGMSVSAGWYPVLEKLFQKIATIAESYNGIIVRIVQIKEKFGGLRVHVRVERKYRSNLSVEDKIKARSEIFSAIEVAEIESLKTCDICSQPGTLRGSGWVRTRCELHV